MGEAPLENDPSPFRRFPCGPAVLCAACLAMAAWTWMRYSYAWDVTPGELHTTAPAWGSLVRLEGVVGEGQSPIPHFPFLEYEDDPTCFEDGIEVAGEPRIVGEMPQLFNVEQQGNRACFATVIAPAGMCLRVGLRRTFVGRFAANMRDGTLKDVFVDIRDTRLHPASVAGLVVAAMGVFVFGLYLRRWGKERRAALG